METSAINTLDRKTENNISPKSSDIKILDYGQLLYNEGIDYKQIGPYLHYGVTPLKGWVIYISLIRQQISSALKIIIPILIKYDAGFKIPENYYVHGMILDGGLGYEQIGKVLSIYPLNEETAVEMANMLISKLSDFHGPEIPFLPVLGNVVYTGFEFQNSGFYPGNELVVAEPVPAWPFGSIAAQTIKKSRKWLNRKYFKVQSLKNDAKGNVYKALNFHTWTNIQWCIIKEGKCCQCLDEAGRDIKDRLHWQYKVQSDLCGIVPLPKPIEIFEISGDTFFVMEYIEGTSYNDLISEIQRGIIWYDLEAKDQVALIKLVLQAIEIVHKLHLKGYVHRDLSPVNFIVAESGNLVAIDIELCYNFIGNIPDPAFTLGTAGYMSPGQSRCDTPVIEDDIYGLGGLLIRTVTGIAPLKYNNVDSETLFNNLNFFIRNRRLATMICSCYHHDPKLRPSLESIKHGLELYLSQIITNNHLESPVAGAVFENHQISGIINKAVLSLFKFPQLAKNDNWYSKTRYNEQLIANDFKSYSVYPEFHSGTAGVIYTLTLADQFGVDLGRNREIFYANFSLIHNYYNTESGTLQSGLYLGTGGLAVVMATTIKYGLLENSIHQINLISNYLSAKSHSPNVTHGVAGQGIAMMACAEILDFPNLSQYTGELAVTLIKQQNKDGSWFIKRDEKEKKGIKVTGFLYGISGIVYFLMNYGKRHYSEKAKDAALKSLNWLLKQRKVNNGHLCWPVNDNSNSFEPWFEYGFTGVAYLFIKAYELFGDLIYKDAAESALRSHPLKITSNYITQASGLAGLGETYLEAHKVFGDSEWLNRACGIVAFFNHTYIEQTGGGIFWLDGSDDTPVADFMTGNSGIIHFLLRFQNPKKIGFPLLSI